MKTQDRRQNKHIWRGIEFYNEQEEYMFLKSIALNTFISINERDRLLQLAKRYEQK